MKILKNLSLLTLVFLTCETLLADGYWSNWLTNNFQGSQSSVVRIRAAKVTQLQAREQSGYGLVNMRLVGGTDSVPEITAWTSTNQSGYIRSASLRNGEFATGMGVRDQWGYGIIDARLLSNTNDSLWLTNNPDLENEYAEECSSGYLLSQIQGIEQWGYGITNLRFYCERN